MAGRTAGPHPAPGHERGGPPAGRGGHQHAGGAGHRGPAGGWRGRGVGGTRRACGADRGASRRGGSGTGGGGLRAAGRGPDRGAGGRPGHRGRAAAVTGTAAIEAEDLTRTYPMGAGTVAALRGVTLRVAAGDYLAVVGPSGSGKSTLMHLLGGLDRPSGGRLVIGGRDVSRLTANQLAELRNRTIGFVFQSFHLLPRTTAVDNVALPLVYRGLSGRARRQRAAAMLGRVGLAHRLDHRPSQLSGGEQQR